MEDAANDPTLHSVSNSWATAARPSGALTDPFVVATENILALAAAAGTTFYFSTGDSGTYESGYPTDSPYVVAVGGTSTYSTTHPGDVEHVHDVERRRQLVLEHRRPPGLADRRRRHGQRAVPGPRHPGRLGDRRPEHGRPLHREHATQRAAPRPARSAARASRPGDERPPGRDAELRRGPDLPGRDAADRLHGAGALPARQQRPTTTSYYRDIECGNTANPTSGPDGDAATRAGTPRPAGASRTGSTSASATRSQLGATNLSGRPSLSPALRVDVREDAEQLDRARVLVPVGLDLLRGRRLLGRARRGTASSSPAARGAR